MQSLYLEKFRKLKETGSELYELRGNRLLVEVLPKEEMKTAGGLIVASDLKNVRSDTEENRPTLALVLATGVGYVDEEGNEVDLDVKVGDIILIPQIGLRLFSQFPGLQNFTANSIALARESEVHMKWPSFEAYEKYKTLLNT